MRTRLSARAVAVALALTAGACATTSFVSTWKAPDAQPVALAGKRVVAMVMSPNESTRRSAEVALARELTARGATGVPAYTVAGLDPKDEAAAKAQLEAGKFDGAVVMRAVGTKTQTTYTPGMSVASGPYGGFYGGYYRYGWGAVYDPGYLSTDEIVSVETLVYSLAQNKLIWGGTSQTTNPSNVDAFVTELSGKVAAKMKSDGLLR